MRNIRRGPNTDGLDIDCCSDVWITNCDLCTGDDAIAVKSDIALLGYDKACERIHISGNTLSSTCCAIRFGFEGDGAIRDIIMTDNIIIDSNIGIDILSMLHWKVFQPHLQIYKGTPVENIIIRQIVMRNVRQAFKLWNYTSDPKDIDELQGYIKNITLADMYIEAVDSSFIGGKNVSGIRLENIRMNVVRFPDACKKKAVEIQDVWGQGYLPKPLTLFNDPGVEMKNVDITESFCCRTNPAE